MLSVGEFLPVDDAPRTVFYDRLMAAFRAHPAWRGADADLLVPAEDTALETNWPRYGHPKSAFLRGSQPDLEDRQSSHWRYLHAVVDEARRRPDRRVLVINMHAFVRLPRLLRTHANILVADGCLTDFERALNPRTVSMPALPMVRPALEATTPRPILASFQGVDSHAVRRALAAIADGTEIVVNFVERQRHWGRVDATAGKADPDYESLLDRSVFGLAPRGDAAFSYRLLEVLARGAIPVILSDGWTLPFDRTIDWTSLAIRVPEAQAAELPAMLRAFSPNDIARLRRAGRQAYERCFAGLDRVVDTLLAEVAKLADMRPGHPRGGEEVPSPSV